MRPEPLSRRTVLAGIAAAAAAPARAAPAKLPVPPGNRLDFTILRAGATVGSHALRFARQGAALQITSDVSIVIYLGPIPVYRYTHHVDETWDVAADGSGALTHATAATNDDGAKHFMRARATPHGLAVEGDQGGSYTAPPGTLIATHWNRAELDGPMVNPQGGKLLAPDVTRGKLAPVKLANGQSVEAHRYALTGDATLDLWYDLAAQWTATRFVASDDSVVLYRRV